MSGLVSVSFRSLSPEQILCRLEGTGLTSIEWGGDIHVPAGDIVTARSVRDLTAAAHLRTFSYGSYYRTGASDPADFVRVLASAEALDTDIIRIWAYTKSRAALDDEQYARVVADTRRICDMAPHMTLCTECHHGTLTEDPEATLAFLADVGRDNLKTYWQPNQFRPFKDNLASAALLAPHCRGVHVFDWSANARFPLAHGREPWRHYIDTIKFFSPGAEFLLEFMHDDRPESLPDAAATLCGWLA